MEHTSWNLRLSSRSCGKKKKPNEATDMTLLIWLHIVKSVGCKKDCLLNAPSTQRSPF